MKQILIYVVIVAATIAAWCLPTPVADESRDYEYEHYCDSVWMSNPDYYLDVLAESDEYCEYVDAHGEWWCED